MTETLLAGLIGHPVAHSRSPALQQAAFDALGIAARYELWDTPAEALAARIAALRQPGYLGANVTIPHKAAVIPLLDALDPLAVRLAAVNTIAREAAAESGSVRLVGYNTDVTGLRRALAERGAWTAGRRMLVLGAGGAAQAALGVAALESAVVWIAARRVEAARAALDAFQRRAQADALALSDRGDEPDHAIALDDAERLSAALATTAVLINATPVGTRDPDASPIPVALLRHLPAEAFVFDMVYNPPETALVRAARALDLRASGGLPMLLYQGADAFHLWTGHEPPLDLMRNAVGIAP
jgi:shikimate dehydrogenase